ncbi:MAG: tetratricopeptide repeat protein [Planctomycetota bacterium]
MGNVARGCRPLLRLGLALALACVGCAGPQLTAWPGDNPLDGLGPAAAADVRSARSLLDEGDTLGGLRRLREAHASHPEHVPVSVALQDAQLEHLGRGEELEALAAWLDANPDRRDADPARELWSWYLSRSRKSEQPLDRLLTARLEPDRAGALFQLEKLAAERPDDPWALLGLAHARLAVGDAKGAQEAIDRSLSLEPANARARRLEALVLARRGELDLSVDALERWLRRTEEHPFVGDRERDTVRLDLAAAQLEVGRARQARRVLNELIDEPRFDRLSADMRGDAYLLRSAAFADGGKYRDALADAQRAAYELPDGLMAVEQRAILLEYRLDDSAGALEAWREVEAIADASGAGLRAYLFALRARVEQARLEGWEPARP